MQTHEIDALNRKGRPAPLLSDQNYKWLWMLFEGLGTGWCDAQRNHPRHGNTVKALLQLAHALWTGDEAERQGSLETALAYVKDAIAGKEPTHHLQDAADARDAKAAEIIAANRAAREHGEAA